MRIDVVVRQEIEDGYLAGPRYRAAGPEITTTGGLGDERKQHMHAESFGMIADGVDEIRRAVRLCCREGVDNVKFNISGDEFVGHARAEIVSLSEEELTVGVRTAHDWDKRVACHSRAAESVKRAVRAGVDCIYHCDFADEEALDMLEAAKDRVIIGPAFGLVHNSVFEGDVVGLTKEVVERMGLPRKLEHTIATYQQMRKRGMRVVVGGDYGFTVTPMGQNARDIGHFVKFFGYSPAEALKCATSVGGESDGPQGRTGRHPGGGVGRHSSRRRQSSERPVDSCGAESFLDDNEERRHAPRPSQSASSLKIVSLPRSRAGNLAFGVRPGFIDAKRPNKSQTATQAGNPKHSCIRSGIRLNCLRGRLLSPVNWRLTRSSVDQRRNTLGDESLSNVALH